MAGPIRIGIDVNNGKANASLRATENSVGRVSARFTKLKAPAAAVAAGFVAVGGGLLQLAKGAAEDEKAQTVLAKTLKNSAGATDAQVKAIEDYISKTGAATGVTDDEMRPALANLVRATKDVGKAQSLMGLAMDVSAGTGKDLGAVTQALAKAQNGSVGGLAKLGIATKDASGKTKSFAQIQADLAKQFKGQAAASAETVAGKYARVKLQLAETGEALGAKLLPAMLAVGTFLLTKFVPGLEKLLGFAERNKTTLGILAGVVAGLAATILVINGAMAVWGGVIAIVSAATKVWAGVQAALNVVMSLNPIGIVVLAVAALVAAIVLAYKNSETFRTVVDKAFGAVKTAVTSVVKFFKEMPGKIATAVGDTAKTLYQKGRGFLVGLAKGYVSFNTTIARFFTGLAGTVVRWVGDTAKTLYQKGRGFLVGLSQGIVSFLGNVAGYFTGLAGNAIRWIGDTTVTLYNKGRAFLIGLARGIASFLGDVARYFTGLAGNAIRWVGDLSRTLYGAGQAIVQGLLNGIASLAGRVAQAAKDLAGKITGPVAKLLNLGSPSRLFKQYGKWTVQGLVAGLRDNAGLASHAASQLSREVARGFGAPELGIAAAPAGAGPGGAGVSITINVDVPFGSAAPEVGRAVADALDTYFVTNGPRPWSRP